ncbi:MAG: hypothetical protein NPIRA03_15600 [Nitrospirales bacterium]|nr:MAG: hypothetical protein NPIRA03_15600 [Nitrospirales bacterium]
MRICSWQHNNSEGVKRSRVSRAFWSCLVVGLLGVASSAAWAQEIPSSGSSSSSMVLEDFQHPDAKGFPQGWEAQRSTVTAHETYSIQEEDGTFFLSAKNANQRVYTKQITWDPKEHPILIWRWRIQSVPDDADFLAAIYPSLDVDLMFIPVNTKYVWSATLPVGSVKEGGMFSSTEIVIRSGTESLGKWVEERINVYEDFLKIHDHEPAPHAWGISLLGGPGVEVDFGSIRVQSDSSNNDLRQE